MEFYVNKKAEEFVKQFETDVTVYKKPIIYSMNTVFTATLLAGAISGNRFWLQLFLPLSPLGSRYFSGEIEERDAGILLKGKFRLTNTYKYAFVLIFVLNLVMRIIEILALDSRNIFPDILWGVILSSILIICMALVGVLAGIFQERALINYLKGNKDKKDIY